MDRNVCGTNKTNNDSGYVDSNKMASKSLSQLISAQPHQSRYNLWQNRVHYRQCHIADIFVFFRKTIRIVPDRFASTADVLLVRHSDPELPRGAPD